MASSFALSTRLGITRGWRVRTLNNSRTYAASVLHCMLIYLLLRAKSFRLGFWVVSYFIACFLKKYTIHVFFWKIPGIKKARIFKQVWGVKLRFARNTWPIPSETRVSLAVGPTRIYALALKRLARRSRSLEKRAGCKLTRTFVLHPLSKKALKVSSLDENGKPIKPFREVKNYRPIRLALWGRGRWFFRGCWARLNVNNILNWNYNNTFFKPGHTSQRVITQLALQHAKLKV